MDIQRTTEEAASGIKNIGVLAGTNRQKYKYEVKKT
jgi:hypothetical protein